MSYSSSLLSLSTTTHPNDENATTSNTTTTTKEQQPSSTSPFLCHGCKKPAIENKRMLRCSRCQSAWYHDRQCQKKHYPIHKMTCRLVDRRIPSSSPPSLSSSHDPVPSQHPSSPQLNLSRTPLQSPPLHPSPHPSTRCDTHPLLGRRLLSTTHLPIGSPILPLGKPLVPPVLHSSQRHSRCSLCFRSLPHPPQSHQRLHLHCSSLCRNNDVFGKEEERVMQELRSKKCCHDVTPTVLLLRRLYLRRFRDSTKTTARRMEELLSNSHHLTDLDRGQMEGIVGLLRLFISSHSDDESFRQWFLSLPDKELMESVARIMMNAFGIADGDQSPLGVGLFPDVAMVNHSCRPNAVATFLLRGGEVPVVRLTVGRDVLPKEEITMSYIDVSPPTDDRRRKLGNDYKFHCTCEKCRNVAYDDFVEGLRCPMDGCSGMGRRVVGGGDGALLPSSFLFQCDVCHYDDFSAVRLRRQSAYDEGRHVVTDDDDDAIIRTLERTRRALRSICRDTSWYVTSNGNSLVDALLHKTYDNDGERRRGLGRAMDMIDEIMAGRRRLEDQWKEREGDDDRRSSFRHCHSSWLGDLSLVILKYTAAKIRLFLGGWEDPSLTMRAVEELKDVRRELLLFYSERCDIVVGLDECLASSGVGL